jgi:hypothetical protein
MDGLHTMFDLETLHNRYNSVIVSIGACKFTFDKGIIDEFYVNIDATDSKRLGLVISKETIEWWSKQSKEARQAWQKNPDPIPLKDALTQMTDWWSKKSYVWANGFPFDGPIIKSSFDAVDMPLPWDFHKEMDLRTVMNLIGANMRDMRQTEEPDTYHNALADAKFQTKCLLKAFS